MSHLHTCKRGDDPHASLPAGQPSPLRVSRTPLSAPWRSSTGAYRMAAAKTEMILPALQITDPLSFPHSPMDNYPKLEEMMMLSSAGTPFLTASAPEGTVFGSGEPGDHYDHLPGGKHRRSLSLFLSLFLAHSLSVGRCLCRACICHLSQQWARRLARAARVGRHPRDDYYFMQKYSWLKYELLLPRSLMVSILFICMGSGVGKQMQRNRKIIGSLCKMSQQDKRRKKVCLRHIIWSTLLKRGGSECHPVTVHPVHSYSSIPIAFLKAKLQFQQSIALGCVMSFKKKVCVPARAIF